MLELNVLWAEDELAEVFAVVFAPLAAVVAVVATTGPLPAAAASPPIPVPSDVRLLVVF